MSSSLLERAEAALAAFAHTAVVIDDEWVVDDSPGVVSGLKAPGLGAGRGAEDPGLVSRRSGHPLNTMALMQAFASKGIVCSVLRPGSGSPDPVATALEPATGRADFVVLDWHIEDDDGQRTIQYVKSILGSDEHRIRLLAIYTGDGDFAAISARLVTELSDVVALEKADEDGHVLVGGPATITLLGKSIATVTGAPPDRVVSEEDLPSRLIRELASRLVGLVPAATLHSLAALRRNAYRILGVLSNQLDVGYLAHRALLGDPDDAQDDVVGLVLSELETLVRDDEAIREAMSERAISQWFDSSHLEGAEREVLERVAIDGLKSAKEQGFGSIAGKAITKKTAAAAFDRETGPESDAAFAMRMTLQTAYHQRALQLTLGAVLHVASTGTYFLCLQPLCDSVRLDIPTAFPLLPCEIADREEFDFVVPRPGASSGRSTVGLVLSRRPRDLEMVIFVPCPKRRAVFADSSLAFEAQDGTRYVQIAALKSAIRSSTAHTMGHAFSRPGIDMPAFLRERKSRLGGLD